MQLFTDSPDFAEGSIGLVELCSSFLNDRQHKKWSKSEKIVYINEAQSDIASTINRMNEHFFIETYEQDIVPGEAIYCMPANLARILGVEIADDSSDTEPQPLVEIPIQDRTFYQELKATNVKKEFGFFFISGTSFRLQPAPSATASGKVRIHQVSQLNRMVNGTDESVIPVTHHGLMATGGARYALIKQERTNTALEMLHITKLQALQDDIGRRSPNRRRSVEPSWGTYGPDFPGHAILE